VYPEQPPVHADQFDVPHEQVEKGFLEPPFAVQKQNNASQRQIFRHKNIVISVINVQNSALHSHAAKLYVTTRHAHFISIII
jgi:hypothetical protein